MESRNPILEHLDAWYNSNKHAMPGAIFLASEVNPQPSKLLLDMVEKDAEAMLGILFSEKSQQAKLETLYRTISATLMQHLSDPKTQGWKNYAFLKNIDAESPTREIFNSYMAAVINQVNIYVEKIMQAGDNAHKEATASIKYKAKAEQDKAVRFFENLHDIKKTNTHETYERNAIAETLLPVLTLTVEQMDTSYANLQSIVTYYSGYGGYTKQIKEIQGEIAKINTEELSPYGKIIKIFEVLAKQFIAQYKAHNQKGIFARHSILPAPTFLNELNKNVTQHHFSRMIALLLKSIEKNSSLFDGCLEYFKQKQEEDFKQNKVPKLLSQEIEVLRYQVHYLNLQAIEDVKAYLPFVALVGHKAGQDVDATFTACSILL